MPTAVFIFAAIVAADDDHQIDGPVSQKRHHRVLSILRRAADRVERLEAIGEPAVAVAVEHRRLQHALDLE